MSIWTKIVKFSWGVLAALILIGVMLLSIPKWQQYRKLQHKRNAMEARNLAKSEEIKDLKIKQERFTSEADFVKRTAREAGMVSKDEVVYKFKDPHGKVQK